MQRKSPGRLFAGLVVISLVLAACSTSTGGSAAPAGSSAASSAAGATCTGAGDKGTVKLMINQWVGAQANVAVV